MEQLNVSYLPTLEDHINMTLEKLNRKKLIKLFSG